MSACITRCLVQKIGIGLLVLISHTLLFQPAIHGYPQRRQVLRRAGIGEFPFICQCVSQPIASRSIDERYI
jgi:hypothetical protein